ncbi:hypothetical protein [Flavobacterium luteolum]|uniref:hypothetical protein n=1 Tax=Flavobacterium luteolum TaxID=3003259 RepID=UPI00248DA847|nr:hypothetical protein [Flavobacterium luteolum]
MKKVILSISAMLFVGFAAVAQNNTSNVDQLGNTQVSSVTQHGSSNDAQVRQGVLPSQLAASNNNTTTIFQQGSGNAAFTSQNNLQNDAYQTQYGNSNQATIWQDQLEGNASQGYDLAVQYQSGSNNKATIDQGTTGNNPKPTNPPFSAAQKLVIDAVVVPAAPHALNDAYQTQTGTYSVAYASQGGWDNYSNQVQNGTGGNDSDKNVSNHYQYGNYNQAWSNQNGWDLTTDTVQIGNYNFSSVTQANNGHSSVVFQNGTANVSNVAQTN